MNWIAALQNAIDYIEDHLTEEIDYECAARAAMSSSHHFQRVFHILIGCTAGEYIRNRRLTLAGAELAEGAKVIDTALRYGYENPDSFARAFARFHGFLPSQAKENGRMLKSYSRLSLEFQMKGGTVMEYRLEEKEAFTLVGYKRRFTGTAAKRLRQEHDFYVSTRFEQYLLQGLSGDCNTHYNVMTNFNDDGYDYYISSRFEEYMLNHYESEIGEEAARFERIEVPAGLYLICETEHCQWPADEVGRVRRRAVTEWLPSLGYELDNRPELSVNHWPRGLDWAAHRHERYVELWLPVVKKA
ncbi:MAG: AraC family transcriptional regulator [Clostridia bacterium]|nr:AraC family transcriptional regulator [Clostridia bacterium]